MNKYLLSAFYALFLPFFCNGQVHKKISLSFNDDDFKFSSTDKELSFVLSRYPVLQSFNESEPNLPFMILHVLVGRDDEYMDVTANNQVISISKGKTVRSYQSQQSKTEKESSTLQNNDHYSKASYPDEYVKYAGTSVVDGYKYLTFHICPFQYRALDKELLFKKQIELDILLEKDSKQSSLLNRGKAMRNVIRHLVVNGDEIDMLYPIQTRTIPKSRTNNQESVDYVIVTADSLKDTFQKLANWKARKGIRCKIETVEDIYNQYNEKNKDGTANRELRLKHKIRDLYAAYNNKYVLLGGGYGIVPVQRCYVKFAQTLVTDESKTPCDLYYSSFLNNLSWNTDDDDRIGEITDNVDPHPQLIVSRLPACNIQEAERMIERIIRYEKAPNIAAWKDSILMVGRIDDISEQSQYSYVYGRYISNGEAKCDSMYILINSYWQGKRFKFCDTATNHPYGANYQVNTANLTERFNLGYPFVHIDTHGAYYAYGLETDTFKIGDVQNINNPSYSLIVSSACNTNDYYHFYHANQEDCLGETFMKSPNSGVIGYWGSSDLAWGTKEGDFSLGSTDLFNSQFYENLFADANNHLGEIACETKLTYASSVNTYSTPYRWLLFSLNLLGEPELPIYLHQPKSFRIGPISFDDGTLGIDIQKNTGDLVQDTSVKVCITSLDDFGESYSDTITKTMPGVFINLPDNQDYSLCFMRPGYRPFVLNCYLNGYIQKDVLADMSISFCENLQIGHNVTTQKANGPVIIENGGSLEVRDFKSVFIKNSFEVKKGAKFKIDPTE